MGGGFHPYCPHRELPPPAHGKLPTHSPHGGILPLALGGHPTHAPHGGIHPPAHGGLSTHPPHPLGVGFFLLASTAKHWHAFTLPSVIPPTTPSFILGGGVLVPPIHFCSPYAPTSVALSLGVSKLTLHSLPHDDAWSVSASNITMSFLVLVPPIASPSPLPLAPIGIPPAPQASALAPEAGSLWSSESIQLLDIKNAKGYLDNHQLIQYYLWLPDYSIWRLDSLLITEASNSEAR
jgi:hypothetical protein